MGSGDEIDLRRPERIDSVSAVARLARSKRVRNILIVVGGISWSALVGVSGWIGGKLELRLQVQDLDKQTKTLSGEIAVLRGQHADLEKRHAALVSTDPQEPGRLSVIDAELDNVRRDLVRTTAATYAGESSSARKHKSAAARDFGDAYKRLRAQGNTRSAAAESLFREVAVP